MNIILIGTGRMGRLLKECALDAGDAVVGEYGRANIAELAAAPAADVAIDFSGPEALPAVAAYVRSEEHTSELPVTSAHLVCRLLLEKIRYDTEMTVIPANNIPDGWEGFF